MKVNFENCRTETLRSCGKAAFIAIIVELEYHIATAGKYNSKQYHKNFTGQEGLCHQ